MEIKVLGSGCSRCKKALDVVNKVVGDSGIDAQVGYVTDIMRMMEYNVMSTPAVGKCVRDAAFFLIIMLVTFAATLLKPQKYVSSRTIQKCVEHVSTST